MKSVETSVNSADSVMVGRQWVFKLPEDKESLKFEKLAATSFPGGTINGRITGEKLSDGSKYSWEADFDFNLPTVTRRRAGLRKLRRQRVTSFLV